MEKEYRGPVIDYESVGVVANLYFGLLVSNGVNPKHARVQASNMLTAIENMPITLKGLTAISDICRSVGLEPEDAGIIPPLCKGWFPEEWRR